MAQHLLIADLSAPLLVIGLRSPVYAFILPRALFAELARSRAAARDVPLPQAAAGSRRRSGSPTLYGWHMAPAYEAALRSPVLHALQHQTFIAASILVWVSVLEPARRRVPGELWKIPHIIGTRFAGMFLGMAFVILQRPIYEGFYGQPGARARPHAGRGPADRRRPDAGDRLLRDDRRAACSSSCAPPSDADRKQEAEDRARAGRRRLSRAARWG